jgi:hypothetical protein
MNAPTNVSPETVTCSAFISLAAYDQNELVFIQPDEDADLLEDENAIPVTLTFNVPIHKLKLRAITYGEVTKYHLINNEPNHILPYELFMNVLRYLRTQDCFTSKLSWNLYPGQPVYEFIGSGEAMKELIEAYHSRVKVELI